MTLDCNSEVGCALVERVGREKVYSMPMSGLSYRKSLVTLDAYTVTNRKLRILSKTRAQDQLQNQQYGRKLSICGTVEWNSGHLLLYVHSRDETHITSYCNLCRARGENHYFVMHQLQVQGPLDITDFKYFSLRECSTYTAIVGIIHLRSGMCCT